MWFCYFDFYHYWVLVRDDTMIRKLTFHSDEEQNAYFKSQEDKDGNCNINIIKIIILFVPGTHEKEYHLYVSFRDNMKAGMHQRKGVGS
jgi:hypothetical protein